MDYKVDKEKVLYADESFLIAGACFYAQKKLGRFAKEKQYEDLCEIRFKELNVPCIRQLKAGKTGNRTDLILYNKILFEIKAIPFLGQDDYAQVQRYLQVLDLELGLLVNFWARSAQPYRILRRANS